MDTKNKRKVKRGEIYYYNFGINEGSIQNGIRPVLIIQDDEFNDYSPTTMIAAITTAVKKSYLPSHIFLGEDFGLRNPCMVMLEQTRTINQTDLLEYVGIIKDEYILREIFKGLKKTFGLWNYNRNRTSQIRCLCSDCLADYKRDPDFIVSRVHPLKRVKDRCDKCRGFGYDYFIADKSKTH